MTWMRQAACSGLGAERFHPPAGHDVFSALREAADALAVCRACPVATECLDHALTLPPAHDQGVRGAMTERDRQVLRDRQGRVS